MNILRMIANLNFSEARENYKGLSKQLKFEYFLVYKYINGILCNTTCSSSFTKICEEWDKQWDKINKILNEPSAKQWTETRISLEMYREEFEEKQNNHPEILFDYYFKLLIFSNYKQLQKQPVIQPTKHLR